MDLDARALGERSRLLVDELKLRIVEPKAKGTRAAQVFGHSDFHDILGDRTFQLAAANLYLEGGHIDIEQRLGGNHRRCS